MGGQKASRRNRDQVFEEAWSSRDLRVRWVKKFQVYVRDMSALAKARTVRQANGTNVAETGFTQSREGRGVRGTDDEENATDRGSSSYD